MSALEAGRELDALVAEKVIGARVKYASGTAYNADLLGGVDPERDLILDGSWGRAIVRNYSTDIVAAMDVLAALGGIATITRLKADEWHVSIAQERSGGQWWAETLPLAICRAAIALVGLTEVAAR